MADYLQVWRATIAHTRVEPLLAVPELVDLGGGTWLDVLPWSVPDGEERLVLRAEEVDALRRMPGCVEDAERVVLGEVAPTW